MRLIALVSLAALAACNSNTSNEQQAFDRATQAQVMLEELEGFAPTQTFRMPTDGTATFNGYSTLRLSTVPNIEVDDVLMLGLAELEVSFDQPGPVTGTVSDLDALVPRGGTTELQAVSGLIDIGGNNSVITDNIWAADYEGDLSWAAGSVSLDGTMDGVFLGNRTSDPDNIIKGVIGGDLDGLAVNGDGGLTQVEFYVYGTDTP